MWCDNKIILIYSYLLIYLHREYAISFFTNILVRTSLRLMYMAISCVGFNCLAKLHFV